MNKFFISFNFILCIVLSVVAILPKVQEYQPRSGLLQSSVVSLYTIYLTWSAMSNQPGNLLNNVKLIYLPTFRFLEQTIIANLIYLKYWLRLTSHQNPILHLIRNPSLVWSFGSSACCILAFELLPADKRNDWSELIRFWPRMKPDQVSLWLWRPSS